MGIIIVLKKTKVKYILYGIATTTYYLSHLYNM